MRIAALYDIHGNLPALEAVLAEVRRASVDLVLVGGDVVPGPMPREALALLRALDTPTTFIQGNGESAVLAARGGRISDVPEKARVPVQWTAEHFSTPEASFIASWPATCRVDHPGLGRLLFCHATPRNNTEIFTARTADERLRPAFAGAGAAVVVCGHTHMPFDRRLDALRIVNAGSVGMPFGEAGADWLLIDDEISFRHTPFDLDAAAARVRGTGYPQRDDFAAQSILKPPSQQTMLDLFSRSELT